MRTPILIALILLSLALIAVGLFFGTADPAGPGGGPDASLAPAAAPTDASAAMSRPVEPTTERAAASTAEPTFASFDEDGNPVEAPVRDGLVILVRTAAGAPRGGVRIVASWRKGFGLYGKDVGRADAAGRFATTVAQVEHFEGIEVEDPQLGELSYRDDFLPMAEDPRTVCVVVPHLGPLRVSVIDGHGAPVADAGVKANGGGEGDVPREHLLRGPERELLTDADGRAEMFVPHGAYEVRAEAADCTLPQAVWADVTVNGGDATLVLLRAEHRIDVTVRVTRPPASPGGVRVDAFTQQAPPRTPAMAGRPGEAIWREFFVDRQSNEEFIVRTEPVPWRVVARSAGCEDAVVDVPVGQTEVHVALGPAPEKPRRARLVITVSDPDGAPTFADIRVHETPDLVNGSDKGTTGNSLVLELEPKGRVCVSASRYGFARHIAGPFDLTPGDHEIRLQLQRPLLVSGRVVDNSGNGVAVLVRLHRPAGVLRGLADVVPEILESVPTSDTLGVEDGVFRFADCGPGEHEIWAFPEHGGLPAKKRVLPGVPATLVLGEGLGGLAQVHTTVRDAATSSPLADVEIGCTAGLGGVALRTDAAGRCSFVAQPGEIRVRACRPGYAVHMTPPRVVGEGPVAIELLLQPSPVFFVRVLDAAGRAVAGAEVSVLGEGEEPIDLLDENGYFDGDSQSTNQAGRADLRGVPVGGVRLRIEHDGRTQDFDVPASAGRSGVFDVRW